MIGAGLVIAICMLPVESHELDDPDKFAVLRCKTETDGAVNVRNSMVTSATGVTIHRGDRCDVSVSSLLQADLKMVHRSTEVGTKGKEKSSIYIFVGDDTDHDVD